MNINRLRSDTSGCGNVIHFNNAGAALMPDIVVSSMKEYLDRESSMGGYETGAYYDKELKKSYSNVAQLINCSENEVAFMESATVAWQRAIHSISFENGDEILTGINEYASNYIGYLQLTKRYGVKLKVVPNDEHGQIDVSKVESLIINKTKLLSMCHIPTGNGLINPVEEVGQIARKHNILYMIDTCQSIGHCDIDVEKLKCDFLIATGRKYLRGPRGTGFLYARAKTTTDLEPLFLDLHGAEWLDDNSYQMRGDAKKYETWESNLPGKYGLSKSIEYLIKHRDSELFERIIDLAAILRSRLSELPNFQVQDTGVKKSGIVTFTHTSAPADELHKYLSDHGVNTSVAHSTSGLLDMQERKITQAVRASLHYYNTEEEIDKVISILSRF